MPLIQVYQDSDTESPRLSDDNLSTMLSTHKKHNLGDIASLEKLKSEILASSKFNRDFEDTIDFTCIRSLFELAQSLDIIAAHRPLYIYEHSGYTISTRPFQCNFDSGQYGIAYITKDEAKAILDKDIFDNDDLNVLFSIIESEVTLFDCYIQGNIFHYILLDDDGDVIDSCGGVYAIKDVESAIKEIIPEKYHSTLDNIEFIYE